MKEGMIAFIIGAAWSVGCYVIGIYIGMGMAT